MLGLFRTFVFVFAFAFAFVFVFVFAFVFVFVFVFVLKWTVGVDMSKGHFSIYTLTQGT